jgi:hypothetical protein
MARRSSQTLGLMKHLAILLLLFSLSAFAAPPKAWLEPVPSSAGTGHAWKEIAATSFFEVPVSKLDTAEVWLADTLFLVQAQSDVAYFGRPDFVCPAATKPYLVRATYINGGTGSFSLHWAGSALIVSHASLGPGGTPSRSALVACLSQAPSVVFSSLSGAL